MKDVHNDYSTVISIYPCRILNLYNYTRHNNTYIDLPATVRVRVGGGGGGACVIIYTCHKGNVDGIKHTYNKYTRGYKLCPSTVNNNSYSLPDVLASAQIHIKI